ncbi:hypothetical protein OE766_22755 [Pararhizobium sp. YC-54]|uniref:hypothetical protein n=1 Tax=Pararhizobium sp. YC-54 TaxID=2986920 RepID=UPI0021F769FB|nr:hypothetical protein [Pararhizobium sp. YC-54]MCW0001055.1 hypothetical protein [Pararhizobium sp. YC-54]
MIKIMNSHAYPGCPAVTNAALQDGPAHVEFGDGVVAGGQIERLDERRIALAIDAYETRKGTAIAAKSWLLENKGGDRWHITRRLDRD